MPPMQQETMGQSPDPPCHGSGLISALCPCPPLVSAPKGEQGCVLKGIYFFNKEISFTSVACHLLFLSADELWRVAQSGRQEEVGKKTSYLEKILALSRPQLGDI